MNNNTTVKTEVTAVVVKIVQQNNILEDDLSNENKRLVLSILFPNIVKALEHTGAYY